MTDNNQTSADREEQVSYLAQRLSIITPMLNRFVHISSKEVGLRSPRDLFLLTLLSKHPVNQVLITKILEINAPTLSKQVDALVQAGLIERTTSEEDRRSQLLTLTELGAQKLTAIHEINERRLKEMLAEASDTELSGINQTAEVLTRLISEKIKSVQPLHKHHHCMHEDGDAAHPHHSWAHMQKTSASGDANE